MPDYFLAYFLLLFRLWILGSVELIADFFQIETKLVLYFSLIPDSILYINVDESIIGFLNRNFNKKTKALNFRNKHMLIFIYLNGEKNLIRVTFIEQTQEYIYYLNLYIS